MYDDGPKALLQRRIECLKQQGLVPAHAVAHDVIAVGGRMLSQDWDTLTKEEKQFSSRTMEIYAAMVHRMDVQIGRVLDYLQKTNELKDTFVLFMSDNGAEGTFLEAVPIVEEDIFDHIAKYYDNSLSNLGKKNSYAWYGPHWASAATAPSRLYKCFSSEGGIRVPCILKYPPLTAKAGGIDHSFTTVMDIAPTILELAGVAHPAPEYRSRPVVPMRGRSWIPYLNGSTSSIHSDDWVTGWELFGRQAIRKGNWKALYIPKPYGPEKWQLYNLTDDPGETNDLGRTHGDMLIDLICEWEKYVKEVGLVGAAVQYGTLRVDLEAGSG